MTQPARPLPARTEQPKDDPLAIGNLPVEVRNQIALRRMQREMAAQIASQNWGAKLDHPTRIAVAAWCQERDVDPATEVDVLGSRPYRNHMYWRRKLAELIQAGLVEYAYPDHVHDDPRLETLIKAGDADATVEANRRLKERIKFNVPDKAAAAVVYHIRLVGMHEDIVGAKWTGGGTRKNDPVGDQFPVETAESRSIRRACLSAVTFLPPRERVKLEPNIQEEIALGTEISASRRRFRESEARLLALPAEPSGSHLPATSEYGGHPDQRLDREQLSPEQVAKAADVAESATDPMQAPPARGAKEEARAAVGTSTSVPMPAPGAVSDAITPANSQAPIGSARPDSSPPDSAPLARAKEKVRKADRKAKSEKKPVSLGDRMPFDEDEAI